jgi:hypothetical protein
MKISKQYIFTTLSLSLIFTLATADQIPLYLNPDTRSEIIVKLDSNHESFKHAFSVEEETKKNESWFCLEHFGTFYGYVTIDRINKNLNVKPETLVYYKPDHSSAVLTTLFKDDQAELVEADDWAKVRFTKPILLYFLKEVPLINQANIEQAPKEMPSTILLEEESLDMESSPSYIDTEALPMRYFEGILKTTHQRLGFRSPYEFKIIDKKGNFLAYVDLSNLLTSTPIEHFLHKTIVIHGAVKQLTNKRHIVVFAQTLHLK